MLWDAICRQESFQNTETRIELLDLSMFCFQFVCSIHAMRAKCWMVAGLRQWCKAGTCAKALPILHLQEGLFVQVALLARFFPLISRCFLITGCSHSEVVMDHISSTSIAWSSGRKRLRNAHRNISLPVSMRQILPAFRAPGLQDYISTPSSIPQIFLLDVRSDPGLRCSNYITIAGYNGRGKCDALRFGPKRQIWRRNFVGRYSRSGSFCNCSSIDTETGKGLTVIFLLSGGKIRNHFQVARPSKHDMLPDE